MVTYSHALLSHEYHIQECIDDYRESMITKNYHIKNNVINNYCVAKYDMYALEGCNRICDDDIKTGRLRCTLICLENNNREIHNDILWRRYTFQ